MTMRMLVSVMAVLMPMFAHGAVTILDNEDGTKMAVAKPVIRPLGIPAMEREPAPVVAAAAPVVVKPAVWIIDPKTDKTYREVFQRWAEQADWTLLWQLPKGYEPRNKSSFSGDFTDVFTKATHGLGRAVGPLEVKFWRGNRVLTVSFLSAPAPVAAKKGTKISYAPSAPLETVVSFVDDAYLGVGVDLPPEAKLAQARAESARVESESAPVLPVWTVEEGAYLKDVLKEWSARAGWGFSWGLAPNDDIRLGARDRYMADFRGAVKQLVNSLPQSVRVRVQLVPENTPPLVYVTREESK